jgi:hypothetical protein
MSEQFDDTTDFSRRTFMKGVGATAGAATLGAGANGASAATDPAELSQFLNWRVREASKVWDRGVRGRPDRTIGLTDSGIDARHPDIGPWNGARVETSGTDTTVVRDQYELLEESVNFAGTLGPGTDGTEYAGDQARATAQFVRHPFESPAAADRIEPSLEWEPADMDLELILEREVEEGWRTIDSASGILSNPQVLGENIEGGERYALTVQTEVNAQADYEIDALFFADNRATETVTEPIIEPAKIGEDQFSGTDAGAVVVGQTTTPQFTAPEGTERVEATLTWTPENPEGPEFNDVEFELQTRDGRTLASSADAPLGGGTGFQEENTVSLAAEVPTRELQFYVVCWRGVAEWTIDATFQELVETGETRETTRRVEVAVEDPVPDADAASPPKVVGWYVAGSRYGEYTAPRDPDGHGSHCSSIMTGTGEASAVDRDSDQTRIEEPRALLVAGDVLTYEVDARAGTGVFASVYGREVDVLIQGPEGRTLAESRLLGNDSSLLDNNVAETPTVHDGGTETYTVVVRPPEGELVSAAQVQQLAVGRFLAPDETDGDRSGEASTLHGGVAPDASLVGLQGLGTPTEDMGFLSEFFAATFNLRSVNMSWGNVGGVPFGATGFLNTAVDDVKTMAEAGILTVAAAGNAFTPANGNSEPAVADEAISVVSTGPLDGIVAYSSGGTGGYDEDGDGPYLKPDVTAPGGRAPAYPASIATGVYDLIDAAKAAPPDTPADEQTIRGYTGKAGTSMASPYANGVAALVAEAMEFDAPDAIALPEPGETDFEDVLRLKQVILATATETVFTAAPYHAAKTIPHAPTYEFGGRDPYEGYGRVNPDAAVDAVSNDLFDPTSPALAVEDAPAATPLETDDDGEDGPASVSTTLSGTVGLDVPADNRALAGYVEAKGGTLDVSVQVDRLSGGNVGMAQGDPHVDLFVYDAERPNQHGEPNIVQSVAAPQGAGSLTVDVPAREFESDDPNTRSYYVVAKLVNVPGVVNGYDVQAHLSVDVAFAAADVAGVTTEFTASGSRSDDGSAFTGGQTNRVKVTVDDFQHAEEVAVTDQVPDGWTVDEDYADVEEFDADNGVVHFEGTVTAEEVGKNGSVSLSYFAEAPEGADQTGPSTFGPATATVVDANVPEEDADGDLDGDGVDTFGGTDDNLVVGPSTET